MNGKNRRSFLKSTALTEWQPLCLLAASLRLRRWIHSLVRKPGIAVEINEEGMRKYAVEGYPFFE